MRSLKRSQSGSEPSGCEISKNELFHAINTLKSLYFFMQHFNLHSNSKRFRVRRVVSLKPVEKNVCPLITAECVS